MAETNNDSIIPELEPVSEFALSQENADYKHLHRICSLSSQLKRYCKDRYLPIFNRIDVTEIMVYHLT